MDGPAMLEYVLDLPVQNKFHFWFDAILTGYLGFRSPTKTNTPLSWTDSSCYQQSEIRVFFVCV